MYLFSSVLRTPGSIVGGSTSSFREEPLGFLAPGHCPSRGDDLPGVSLSALGLVSGTVRGSESQESEEQCVWFYYLKVPGQVDPSVYRHLCVRKQCLQVLGSPMVKLKLMVPIPSLLDLSHLPTLRLSSLKPKAQEWVTSQESFELPSTQKQTTTKQTSQGNKAHRVVYAYNPSTWETRFRVLSSRSAWGPSVSNKTKHHPHQKQTTNQQQHSLNKTF